MLNTFRGLEKLLILNVLTSKPFKLPTPNQDLLGSNQHVVCNSFLTSGGG